MHTLRCCLGSKCGFAMAVEHPSSVVPSPIVHRHMQVVAGGRALYGTGIVL